MTTRPRKKKAAPPPKWRLLPHWHQKLTHAYSSWCIYLALAANFVVDKIESVAAVFPMWITAVILVAALVLGIVKQESVSGKDA